MQRLQDYARLDYRFYFQGEVGLEKLNSLSRKFAQQYDTELSKFQRARRKRSGEAVTQLLIWIPEDSDKARFWLMATEGKGRVHEYETLRDLRDKSNRISLSDYELVHDGVSWSWRMTQATYTFHQKRLRNAILARNDLLYGVAVASLYQSPGFRLVRRQVGMLARIVEERRVLAVGALHDVFERLSFELSALQQVVSSRDIGIVMLVVMVFQRLLGHVGLERIVGVGQGRQGEGHEGTPERRAMGPLQRPDAFIIRKIAASRQPAYRCVRLC